MQTLPLVFAAFRMLASVPNLTPESAACVACHTDADPAKGSNHAVVTTTLCLACHILR